MRENKRDKKAWEIILITVIIGIVLSAAVSAIAVGVTDLGMTDGFFMTISFMFIFIALSIPVLIGVFVYRDAKKLGLNALFWALVSVFAPGFIGIIAYLIYRTTENNRVKCFKCGSPIESHFTTCPMCGAEINRKCPSCGKGVREEWEFCAHCSARIK